MRRELMPIANKYSMDELMEAARYYTRTTGRRITFEYSLVKGVNDKKEHAQELISRVKGMNCHINLIPVNQLKFNWYNATKNGNDYVKNGDALGKNPTDAGDYIIEAVFAGDNNINAATSEWGLTIGKADHANNGVSIEVPLTVYPASGEYIYDVDKMCIRDRCNTPIPAPPIMRWRSENLSRQAQS